MIFIELTTYIDLQHAKDYNKANENHVKKTMNRT